jgi:plastocyanin
MSVRCSLAISLLALAACGGGGGETVDAPAGVDAKASNVMEVTCPATTPVTFTTTSLSSSFNPTTASITLGQIVKFDTALDHPIGPISGDPLSDPGLVVGGGMTKCFNFLAKGTYKFRCTTHNFVGTLTVN